jgi:hypothetical protein
VLDAIHPSNGYAFTVLGVVVVFHLPWLGNQILDFLRNYRDFRNGN